jgi:ferredoxin-nitrite reductase
VPRIARDLGVFVPKDEAVEVPRLARRLKGDPTTASHVKSRMKFIVDDYGPEDARRGRATA